MPSVSFRAYTILHTQKQDGIFQQTIVQIIVFWDDTM